MTDSLPPCPECSSVYTYELGALLVCPECAHEWAAAPEDEAPESAIRDSVGNVLADGGGGHDIDCKVVGFGSMKLKSSIVKKA